MFPKSIHEMSRHQLRQVKVICFDIDDTFSLHGKILSEAYEALWKLKRSGYVLVPVTGRPAGWCDHIVRFWPVDAIVGENGAFIYYLNEQNRKKELIPPGSDPDARKKCDQLAKEIKKQFPEATFASDQSFRVNDLAIDLCEDVEPWSSERTEALLAFCLNKGAHAKLSSIHVNTWFGDFDKLKGLRYWVESGMPGVKGIEKQSIKTFGEESWMYFGDSPNDEPLFGAFLNSVGVSNVKPFLEKMKLPPQWITSKEGGLGFAETVDCLLLSKSSDSD